MAMSWRDALRRGGDALPDAVVAPPGAAAAMVDPASVSAELAALVKEREALQASIEALGAAPSAPDPRYPVAPLAERRAEIERWARKRDERRPTPPSRDEPARVPRVEVGPRAKPERTPANSIETVAGRLLGGLTPVADSTSPPALPMRATPGETPAGGGTPTRSDAFSAARDTARALAAARNKPTAKDRPDAPRGMRAAKPDDGGMLDRAFDRWSELRDAPRRAEALLDRARKAIPDDWAERARRAIPALGDGDGYDRRMKALLKVAVGSVDEVGEQADRLRALARDVRELRAADAANDDARRDRAIEKLKARRGDGG